MNGSKLCQFYKHFDNLVSDWLDENTNLCQGYMPEPWWGWTPESGVDLVGVVINLNPGEGGRLQRRKCVRCAIGDTQYSVAMQKGLLSQHLAPTAAWHREKREKPILNAIGMKEGACSAPRVLCIESYPLHTPTFDENKVIDYLSKDNGVNLKRVLQFSGEASRHCNSSLKNVVLIRISSNRWQKLIANSGVTITPVTDVIQNLEDGANPDAKAQIYKVSDVKGCEDIAYICVWHSRGRNNFPKDLDKLLKSKRLQSTISDIINNKLTK